MSLILLGILNSQVAGGGAGAYDLLETQILTSSASSVEFTGLGSYSDYKHFQVRWVARDSSGGASLILRINSDTGSNYASHGLHGDGSSVTSVSATSATSINLASIPGPTTNIYGVGVTDVLDFEGNKNKTTRTLAGRLIPSSNTNIQLRSGLFINTSAVTSLQFLTNGVNVDAGSRFSLYGVK
jgi:hypothetical protein